MNDVKLGIKAPDGRRFMATIYEGKYVPPGMVKWSIEVEAPTIECWYRLEWSSGGWLLDDAIAHCHSRLEWWAANYLDMPVARQIGATL